MSGTPICMTVSLYWLVDVSLFVCLNKVWFSSPILVELTLYLGKGIWVYTQAEWPIQLELILVFIVWSYKEYSSLLSSPPRWGASLLIGNLPPPPPSISSGFPDNSPVPICVPGWRERHCESRVCCIRTKHNDPGPQPRPLEPESSTLTTTALCLLITYLGFYDIFVIIPLGWDNQAYLI